jgi:hypothetical protein
MAFFVALVFVRFVGESGPASRRQREPLAANQESGISNDERDF